MANKWPDGGEKPLTRGETLVVGALATFVVAIPFDATMLIVLRLLGPPPTWPMVVITCAIGVAAGATWIRPWETDPARRR